MWRREPPRKNRPPPGSGGGKSSNASKDAAAKILTSQMKEAKSATELLNLLDGVVDRPIFNYFHASAAYYGLATWKRNGGLTPSEKKSPVLPRLAARVRNMFEEGQVEPRAVANVLYSLGKLSDDLDISKGLLIALGKSLGEKASGMEPQGLSNSLLACVQLKHVAPEVLTALPEVAAQVSIKEMVPQALSNSLWAAAYLKDDARHEDVAKLATALACQIPVKAKDMIPQHLSNSLWAAAQLKDIAPDVKEIVPAIVAQMEDKANGMKPQELSNSLWAAAKLKDDGNAPYIREMVREILTQIEDKANGMKPQELSNSLWAANRLKDDAPEVLQMVPALVKEIPYKQADFKSQEICNCLEALVLLQDSVPEVGNLLAVPPDSKTDFVGFIVNRFNALLPKLKGKSLSLQMPLAVWACGRVNFYNEEFLVSVSDRLKSVRELKPLPDWGLCALLWSYDVLDPDDQFANFKNALKSERVRRGLSDADVSRSQSGYFEWNRAKG